jgi:parvulin-like peptidyl-prolyl isomerase
MKVSRMLFVALIVAVVAAVVSCGGGGGGALAEFQDQKITVSEFEEAYAKVDPKYLPRQSGIEGYEEFLTTMLNKEVMAYKADELGYDKDQAVINGMDAFKKMGLQTAYLKLIAAGDVKVSDEEVREHYRNKGATLSVKQILVDTPDEAEEVRQILVDGGDFDSVCRQYSKGPDADAGGKVLTMTYGSFGPDLQRAIFSLPVGGVSEPVLTPYGFFVIKVLRRTEARNKEPFDDNQETLYQEVRVYNEMLQVNAATDKIREDVGTTWFWSNFHIVFAALPPDRSINNPPNRKDEVYPLLFFEEDDLAQPLLSYKDKTVTIGDFSDYYDGASFFARPRRDFRFGGIRSFLTERMMAEIVPEEMERSKIADHPEVKRILRAKQEELMINRLWDDMINQQTVVTEREIQDYYDQEREFFKIPEKRRFGVILTGDLDSATEAYNEIKGGKRFRTVAMAYSIDESTRESLAETEMLSEGEQPEMDKVGFAIARVGDVAEPFETSRGWMVLKLTEKQDEHRLTYNEAKENIRPALKQSKNEERLNELLEKWKEELGVVIHKNNLSKINVEERSVHSKPER